MGNTGEVAKITSKDVLAAIYRMCDAVEENKGYLCELDAALGDGDHGVSMSKSFRAVRDKLPSLEGKDVGTILRAVGMALISTVGGAMGPLFGSAFLKAGERAAGKQEIGLDDIVDMFIAGEEAIVARGKAKVGDKTLLDTVHPAVEAIKEAKEEGLSISEALRRATGAAELGMKSTIDMIARVGRASRLGERTIGHQDPGATSAYIIIKAASMPYL
ncbi:MAG TPA: dihydroxyacetone kinase subunit L [Firmicutes bacterium]|nr:dihydroxyacetone kinase subunit L [Bacillota bacterium]